MPITGSALAIAVAAAMLIYGVTGVVHGVKKLNCKITHHTCPVKPLVVVAPPPIK